MGQGEVGGATTVADCAWRLLQLAIEKARSALDGPLYRAWRLLQLAIEKARSALHGPLFCFLVRVSILSRRLMPPHVMCGWSLHIEVRFKG